MEEQKHPGGRPSISEEQKKDIVSRLEPYLKTGLSISKACLETKISRATFYRLMEDDEEFRDKINQFRNFVSVLVNNALVRELQTIIEKQNGNEARGIKPQRLAREDRDFLWKFALTSSLTKEEWGKREDISLFDPEAEIQRVKRMMEETSTKDLPPLPADSQ